MKTRVLNLLLTLVAALSLSLNSFADETVTYFHLDSVGSPIASSDASGNIIWTESFSPHGTTNVNAYESVDNRRGFTGHVQDESEGLVYMGSRYYDPEIGRFNAVDPVAANLERPATFNRYSYAANNPYRYVDAHGDVFFVPILIFVAKEVAGEAFEQATGIPAPTVKNAGKLALKAGAKQLTKRSDLKEVTISKGKFPESAKHIEEALKNGKPDVLTINRAGAKANRKESLKGIATQKGKDRDEFPPAMFQEGGKGASVKHISSSDNRGAGACMGGQCRGLPDGTKIKLKVVD